MTKTLRIILVIGFTAALAGGPANCAEPQFSLSMSAPRDVIKAGSEVIVKILLKNSTDHDLRFVLEPGGPSAYEISVTDGNGRPAPYTDHGARIKKRPQGFTTWGGPSTFELVEAPSTCTPEGRYSMRTPPTHKCGPFCAAADIEVANRDCGLLRQEVILTELFDLTKPGKYAIQFQRNEPESKTTVRSNTITVTITP